MPSYRPRRWTQGAETPHDPEEAEAGRLLREARALKGPSAQALARIRQQVEARAERTGQAWFAGRHWSRGGLVTALVGAVALASVGAVVVSRRTSSGAPADFEQPAPQELPAPTPEAVPEEAEPVSAEALPSGAVGLEPEGEKPPSVHRRPQTKGARVSPPKLLGAPAGGPSVDSAPVASDLAAETALLGKALRQQNHEHNPAAALATLEEHRRRFPHGALADEARAAQLHALMTLGRHKEALSLIEEIQAAGPGTIARRTELSLLQAEVLTRLGRCAEALPFFDAVVSLRPSGELLERANQGQAACRSRR